MSKDNVVSLAAPESGGLSDPLTDLLRVNARRLIGVAVAAEFEECLSAFEGGRLPDDRLRVVRNGSHPQRKILTGIGVVEVAVPKARSRSGGVAPLHSPVAPPYVRRCASLDAAIPWLYLRGVSTGSMREAVSALVGEEVAAGLSPNVVTRLKREWWGEYGAWKKRGLDDNWVYVWADGIHSGLRGDEGRLCALVAVGVNARGEKHFLATGDGVRESAQSWREVLLDLKRRGLTKPPKLAVGDGAPGFWSALSEVCPETPGQRCWMHKSGNVLNHLPKAIRPKVKEGLHQIWMAETRDGAEGAFDHWLACCRDKYPKAADCLGKDREELLAFYDFPAKHWTRLRATNVIESAFATIRHRSSRAKGCVTRKTMLSMICKMGISAGKSWKRLRGFQQLGQVIEGVQFKDGRRVINEHSREAA